MYLVHYTVCLPVTGSILATLGLLIPHSAGQSPTAKVAEPSNIRPGGRDVSVKLAGKVEVQRERMEEDGGNRADRRWDK